MEGPKVPETDQRDALRFLEEENERLRAAGVLRWPRELHGAQAPVCVYDGRRVINLCANNYLGLAAAPALKAAAAAAIEAYGVGSGAVRTIAGNMTRSIGRRTPWRSRVDKCHA